jgi:hypothetical protein
MQPGNSRSFGYLALMVGSCVAAVWAYTIWNLDWGPPNRGYPLYWMLFSAGSALAFLFGAGIVAMLDLWLFPPDKGS